MGILAASDREHASLAGLEAKRPYVASKKAKVLGNAIFVVYSDREFEDESKLCRITASETTAI